MNKEQLELLDEAYKNYCNNVNLPPTKTLPLGTKVVPTLYTQKEFINKNKTDNKFSEKWGYKIEERELGLEERVKLYEQKTNTDTSLFPVLRKTLDFHNIPTKLIAVTYKDKTIESYE